MQGAGRRSVAETEVEQRLVQHQSGIIAGKRPAAGVGPVHTRRQADDQQSGFIVTERRDRAGVVAGVLLFDVAEEGVEAGALAAVGIKKWGCEHSEMNSIVTESKSLSFK